MTFINLIQASGKKTRRFGCALLIALIVMQATTQAATITVTGTGDTIAVDGLVTLREAITSANNNANVNADVVAVGAYGTDTINFAIVGAGVHTISPTSALPTVTDTVVVNGFSQPGSSANTLAVGDNAVLRVEINGTNAPGGAFIVNSAGNTFEGLVINRFFNASFNPGYAFRLTGTGNTIQGCYLGTNPAGDTDLHNTGGVSVEAGGNNLIGGPSAAARNVILGSSGNNAIEISGGNGNTIQGNYVGTNAAGSAILGVPGIDILTANNTIGGTVAGARNVTFSNGGLGINLRESAASGNTIQGNFIGIKATGNATLGGNTTGISLLRAPNNLIGGTAAGAGNVISGNAGYSITATQTDGLIVQGNLIGTNAAGTAAVPNNGGIVFDGSNNTIGGTTPGARNIISGSNPGYGIRFSLDSTTTGNFIQGNYIGTDITGTVALGNIAGGMQIFAFQEPTGVNTVGGTTAGARNIISANGDNGILLQSSNILIQGNYIGTDVNGTADLGNGASGIFVQNSNDTIGGTAAGAGNVIAFNGQKNAGITNSSGVYLISSGTGNAILGNSIFSNAGLGIDLPSATENSFRVTPNDLGDGDTGANNLQNFPVLETVSSSGGMTNITGRVNSAASTTYRIEFFANDVIDPSSYGEGQIFLGFKNVTTSASGNANFTAMVPQVAAGQRVTSTATDPNGNTSEFSGAIGQLLNVSTRMEVLTGGSVLIGGFIIGGTGNKDVLLRALGPTLQSFGITGFLADPTLELRDVAGALIMSNDNWKDTQQAAISATGKAPPNDLEPAILHTFAPGNYTGIVRGKNNTTGIGLIEAYDLDQSPATTLTNISTRGFVDVGQNAMIGGFISGNGIVRVIVRALGPTLTQFGVPNVLADPILDVRDAQGNSLATNDNWADTQQAEIQASGKAPPDTKESAIIIVRPAGNTTAIVTGKNNTTGNALVEAYILTP